MPGVCFSIVSIIAWVGHHRPGLTGCRAFRLGDHFSARLPTAREYALSVDKEHRWLPVFAVRVPLTGPVPVARGVPDDDFPFEWSVYARVVAEICAR